ncbi:MAG: pyridoxal phosphate-dependent aminotransferase [Spirochaetaceae bacterium]|nr:MAG: pyridoxal phosphate-dependent aminotransferase [Spirochaetaceae bacterium]
MTYDFDTPVDRRGTASVKWDFSKRFAGLEELTPLWVADMDFPSCSEVIEALKRRAEHGVFGYTLEPESYYQAVIDWMERRHGWEIRRGWMLSAPGVVPSLSLAVQSYSRPGDRVIIQPPVYFPFKDSILNNERQVAENPLTLEGGRYTMNFDQLEQLIDERTRLLILCSPHNPVARVWSREELERLVEICQRHKIIILSDEIHHDLVLNGHRHLPTASLSEEAASITVTFTAATKTFNLAGLGCSLVIASDNDLRERFRGTLKRVWGGIANAFSAVATESAYRHGESWLSQVLEYIQGNYDFLVESLAEGLPEARVFPLEGTYLAWIDLRALGLSDEELKDRILKQARVWLDDGPMFGSGGEGFQRINLACSRNTLAQALDAMLRVLG